MNKGNCFFFFFCMSPLISWDRLHPMQPENTNITTSQLSIVIRDGRWLFLFIHHYFTCQTAQLYLCNTHCVHMRALSSLLSLLVFLLLFLSHASTSAFFIFFLTYFCIHQSAWMINVSYLSKVAPLSQREALSLLHVKASK